MVHNITANITKPGENETQTWTVEVALHCSAENSKLCICIQVNIQPNISKSKNAPKQHSFKQICA